MRRRGRARHSCCVCYVLIILQDEVLYENEKFVLKLDDLLNWICDELIRWPHGLSAINGIDIDENHSSRNEQRKPLMEIYSGPNGRIGCNVVGQNLSNGKLSKAFQWYLYIK